MDIHLAHDKKTWNSWLTEHNGSFLQSWEWGEILHSEGKFVERLRVSDGSEIVAQAQVVYTKLPFGMRYGFCPAGPVAKLTINKEQLTSVWGCFKDYFLARKIILFRVEPSHLLIDSCSLLINKSIDLTPRATTILDLSKSNDELLANMHEKTRYNIRLAQKKELKIERLKDFDSFWKLSHKTAERDGFRLHPREHYQAVLASPLTHQITIYYNEQPVAAAVLVGFGDTLTYLFGASDHDSRQLMASHLIQWEGIQLGKKLGYSQYDFFGIAPSTVHSDRNERYQYNLKHQYARMTRFKLGFGGTVAEDPGTFDLIISPVRYKMYQALRWLRRLF